MGDAKNQVVADEWVSFPGGELEGTRPKELCAGCRERANRAAGGSGSPVSPVSPVSPGSAGGPGGPGGTVSAGRLRTLCFQCYRAGLDRGRALLAAAELDTTTVRRFQTTLPFEPVNKPRLAMLKVDRATAREATRQGMGQFVNRRRQAQIAARRALQAIVEGVNRHNLHNGDNLGVLNGAARAAQAVPGVQPIEGRQGVQGVTPGSPECGHGIFEAIRAAELQLPESWLPFVVSR
jgi:hypothetical protein